MPTVSPDRRRAIAAALEEAVRKLPSIALRLTYLASVRDPDSGVYGHPAVSGATERGKIDGLLRRLHEEAFATWLNCKVEGQKV